MADRKLIVQILGDERDLSRAFRTSSKNARIFEAQMTKTSRGVRNVFAAAGVTLGAAAIVKAVRSTVGAAISFESSFAGVRKTVDATEPQLLKLAGGFRAMSREIPVSVDELNRIGEAAGQLGIQRAAILGFTRTVADLGVATNLTSEQAADALARIANITRLPQDQFDRLGATVVELGNRLAATESEIVDFGLRIAAAGKIIGLTEAQTLAVAGAFTSVGVEAEAGGTAVSKVFIALANAARSGGKTLEQFAATAGTSTEEFRSLFEKDAAGAFVAFTEGLKRVDDEGGNVFKTLKNLGLTDVRLIRAFLSISQSGDLLAKSLAIGSRAWQENSALTKEAEKRYGTTASKLQLFQNRVNDLQITLGNVLAPALLDIVNPLGEWAAKTENQEDLQRKLKKVVGETTAVVQAFVDVVKDVAPVLQRVNKLLGGTENSVAILLTVFAVSKIFSFVGAITGLSTAALTATGRVTALRLALLRLGALGVVAVGVTIIMNRQEIHKKVTDFLKKNDPFLAPGGGLNIPVDIDANALQVVRDRLAAISGEGNTTVIILDRVIKKLREVGRAVSSQDSSRGEGRSAEGIAAANAVATTARKEAEAAEGARVSSIRGRRAFDAFVKGMGLKLDKAAITETLTDDLAALHELERAILRRIKVEGRTFELEQQLTNVRAQIASTSASQREATTQKAIDAYTALIDSLNLGLERAQITTSLVDDLAALREIESAIRKRISVEGRTTALARELFQNRQEQAALIKQQGENARDRRKGNQFEKLGLTEEGEKRTPSKGLLLKRAGNLLQQIKGTVLDTPKTQRELNQIINVLKNMFGKGAKEVREAILEMLNTISGKLDNKKGPLTKTHGLATSQIIKNLGLTVEQAEQIQRRLAHATTGGVAFTTTGTSGGGRLSPTGRDPIVVESRTDLYLDGVQIASAVTRQQQKAKRRNPKQKRGPNRR